MVFKELSFYSFYIGSAVLVFKELILIVFALGRSGVLQRTDLKELISKNLTVSTLGRCGVLQRTQF